MYSFASEDSAYLGYGATCGTGESDLRSFETSVSDDSLAKPPTPEGRCL